MNNLKVKHQCIFNGFLKIKNNDMKIPITFEYDKNKGYRIFTDALKYGDHLEIIYCNKKGCYVIKNLNHLRDQWNKTHNESTDSDQDFKDFLEVDI